MAAPVVTNEGLAVNRLFTKPGATIDDVFDAIEWEIRDAIIGNPEKPAFEQRGVEFPKTWSQNATNIVAQKYFRGQLGSPEREHSVKQMVRRVAVTITDWSRERGYFASDEDANAQEAELAYILVHQLAAFNSPVWFNVGFEENPQCSACFILSVDDQLVDGPDSILQWNEKEAIVFRGGSGSGINLSRIRGSREPLSKGGLATGPVSFMQGADAWAGTIKSGGKTRRAAKMVILDIDHPDILDFIRCKVEAEEVAALLRDNGYDMRIDSEAFRRYVPYQNANNSVRVTDEFMGLVETGGKWQTKARVTGEPVDEYDAQELMREIADAAWRCADPGIQYDTIINEWHTCPNSGRINASNPCSEYMHVDDSACNLASINLMKFRREDGTFDVEKFNHVVDVIFLAQEITVGTEEQPASSFPTKTIGERARQFRQIGLGYANLGALLMSNGMPYDSNEGRAVSAAITALMTGRAYRRSAEIAAAMGPYARYDSPELGPEWDNREAHNAVMLKHWEATAEINSKWGLDAPPDVDLYAAACRAWGEAKELGDEHGYRNAQATVLAPTGTISFLMDCDTTGVEPDFSLVKFKELVGGGNMTIVNQTVKLALETLGYESDVIGKVVTDKGQVVSKSGILGYIVEHGTIVGAPGIQEKDLPVFDVAVGDRAISWRGHVDMMAAVQPFISGAISKTVNMPNSASVEDIADAYTYGWKAGLKALAIYRDGSKTAQALRTDAQKSEGKAVQGVVVDADGHIIYDGQRLYTKEDLDKAHSTPIRRKMPKERQSITHKMSVGGHEGYITAGMYEDGTLGEIFLTDVGKEGTLIKGLMNALATAMSIGLQYGVPLVDFVDKFAYIRFEPEGATGNQEIPFAKSMPDYIVRWLAARFCDTDVQEQYGILTPAVRARKAQQEALMRGDTSVPAEEINGNGHSNGHTEAKPALAAAVDEAPAAPPAVLTRSSLELGPPCTQCGGMMQRTGSCYTCTSCGSTTGCG